MTFEGTQTIHDGALYLDTSDLTDDDAPEIHLVGYNGHWYEGIDFVNPPTSRDWVMLGVHTDYAFNDGVTTNGSPTLTSASEGGFAATMVGTAITGPGIPSGTTVSAVASATSLTMSHNATATASGVRVHAKRASSNDDIWYAAHRGARTPCVSLAHGKPNGDYIFELSPDPDEYAMGGLYIRNPRPNQTGRPFTVADGNEHVTINSDFHLTGSDNWTGSTLAMRASTGKTTVLAFINAAKTYDIYGFSFTGTSDEDMKFSHLGGYDFLKFKKNGGSQVLEVPAALKHTGSALGFFNATPAAKPTGVAVTAAGVHAALVTLGLISA